MSGLARFFTDRGVGSRIVPEGLRSIGWRVVTMDERYGKDVSQSIPDTQWIADACTQGELILTKDRAVSKRSLEAEAISVNAARVLVVGSANITGQETLARILQHRERIQALMDATGPFVFSIGRDRIDTVRLRFP